MFFKFITLLVSISQSVGYQYQYITCWSSQVFEKEGAPTYADPSYATDRSYNGGDICDHNDAVFGERRNACYFQVIGGKSKWKRSCIHREDIRCPVPFGSCNTNTFSGVTSCCCDNADKCNAYEDLAQNGIASNMASNSGSNYNTGNALLTRGRGQKSSFLE